MEKRQKIVIFGLVITIFLLILLRIYIIVEMTVYDNELAQIQEIQNTIKQENSILELEYLQYSSYATVYPEAVRRGFVPLQKLFY